MEFLDCVEIGIVEPMLNRWKSVYYEKDPLHYFHYWELKEGRKQTFAFFPNATGSHVYMTIQT